MANCIFRRWPQKYLTSYTFFCIKLWSPFLHPCESGWATACFLYGSPDPSISIEYNEYDTGSFQEKLLTGRTFSYSLLLECSFSGYRSLKPASMLWGSPRHRERPLKDPWLMSPLRFKHGSEPWWMSSPGEPSDASTPPHPQHLTATTQTLSKTTWLSSVDPQKDEW